jgi:hypothetical protein
MRICSAIQKRTNNKKIKYFGRSENFVAEPLGLRSVEDPPERVSFLSVYT